MASLSDSFTPSVGRLRTFLTGQRNDPGTAPPEPSPATPAWQPMAPSGDASRVTPSNPAGIKFAHGGRVRGPGTGTSDSIKARLSDGEYVLPTDTVAAMGGADALDRVKDATHQPVRSLAGGFANGGLIDPLRPTSFGDAAAASNSAGVTQLSPVVAPGGNAVKGMTASEFVAPTPMGPVENPNVRSGIASQQGMDFQNTPRQAAQPSVGPGPSTQASANPNFRTAPAAPTIANSFGDAAAASSTPGTTQTPTGTPTGAAAAPGGEPASMRQRATASVNNIWDDLRGKSSMGPMQPQGRIASGFDVAKQGTRIAGKLLGPAVDAYKEGREIASVAQNPNAQDGDTMTQVAQGVGRFGATTAGALAGAQGGAWLGALGGPLAPITVPVGAALGGIAGGAAGYWGADKTIQSGRAEAGVETQSPYDRLKAEQPTPPASPANAPGYALDPSSANQGPPSSANVPNRIGNSFDQGTTVPGDLPNNVRDAMGIKNGGVGVVGAAGVTSADTLGQAGRDLTHMREMNVLNKGQAGFSGTLGTSTGLLGSADDRQSFFDNANLRNAAAKGSWSPRGGYKTDEGAIAAAQAPITARNQRQIADFKNTADLTAARMTDATNRRDTDVRADASKYGADATYKAATIKPMFDAQQRAISGKIFNTAGGNTAGAATLANSLGYPDIAKAFTEQAAAQQTAEATTQSTQDKAVKGVEEATQVIGADNKVDLTKSQASRDVVGKLFPKFATMTPAAREAALPDMKAMSDIFAKTMDNKQMGFDRVIPWKQRDVANKGMPDFKGGELKQEGPIDGRLTVGSSAGSWYVTDRAGTHHPLGEIDKRQMEMINRAIKTGVWSGSGPN